MKLQIEASKQSLTARTATLSIKSKLISTPNFIHYTSLGSVPHLTPDLLKNLIQNQEQLCFSVAIESFVNLVSDVFTKRDGRKTSVIPLGFQERFSSLHSYLAMPLDNSILFADLRDLYQWLCINPNLKNTDQFSSSSTLSEYVFIIKLV